MRLSSRRIAVPDLTRQDRANMFALFARYYEAADPDRFEADLARKQWVIQLIGPATGDLVGFSTQVLWQVPQGSDTVSVLFSGDTIVDPTCWGETALIRQWGRMAVELMEVTRPAPLYWFLITKGYKTYRFLPVFFREFFPRHDCSTPAWATSLLDTLGQSMFGEAYDGRRGLVIPTTHRDRLRPGIADITPARLADPHVRFFVDRNPGHAQGDELCCVAHLDVANFTPAGIRLLDPQDRPAGPSVQRDASGVA